jgi:hypothetical protein
MLPENTYIIPYARVSSNKLEQIQSLDHQCRLLSKYGTTIADIHSGGNGMTDNLKTAIISAYDEHKSITLVATSLDRISRNYTDMEFIRKYISHIQLTRDNKIYEVESEWRKILDALASATEELDIIKKRSRRTPTRSDTTKTTGRIISEISGMKNQVDKKSKLEYNHQEHSQIGVKRKRSFDDLTTLYKTKRRCITLGSILEVNGISSDKLEALEEMVKKSQKLETIEDWLELSTLSNELGGCFIMDDYEKTLADDSDQSYRLTKADITAYVKQICPQISDVFLKEFIHANMSLSKITMNVNDSNYSNGYHNKNDGSSSE